MEVEEAVEGAAVAIKPKPKMQLFGLVVPFFLAAVLIFGYYLYWTKIARQIEDHVRAALPRTGAASVKVTGFPYRLTLDIKDFKVTARNGLGFTSSSVVATASPFNPLLWVLEGALDPALALPGGPLRPLTATNLKASLRLHQKGLARVSLTFDSVQSGGVGASGVGGWAVGKGLFHAMTRSKNDDNLAMVIDLTDIQIATPLPDAGAILGQKLQHVFISGPITQGQALMQSTQAWRDAGGKLTIMAGDIIWGPVYFTNATGEMRLSENNTWQGSLTGQGALKPEGVAVSGLSGPVSLEIKDNKLFLSGLPGIDLSAMRFAP